MRFVLILVAILAASPALAGPCTANSSFLQYVSPYVQPMLLTAQGNDDDDIYVLQVDPDTCKLIVDAEVSLGDVSIDIDYGGTPGAAVPATAAFVGGTDGTNLRGLKTDAGGELQIDVLSSTLPSGAATSAKQDTGNTSLATVAGAVSGTEMQVDIVTTPSPTGRTYADSARLPYGGTSVTTGAWVELDASTAATINGVLIFDSSGQTLELGVGAAAAEVRKLIIPPGGIDGFVPLAIPAGSRLSLRAISGTASVGELVLTGLQ